MYVEEYFSDIEFLEDASLFLGYPTYITYTFAKGTRARLFSNHNGTWVFLPIDPSRHYKGHDSHMTWLGSLDKSIYRLVKI